LRVTISHTIMPNEYTSAFSEYLSPLITSGAVCGVLSATIPSRCQ
jgi:hypothetical protein